MPGQGRRLYGAWEHIEADVADVAGVVLADGAAGEEFDLVFSKNEPIVGGFPGKSFVFMEFEQGGGVLEFAALAVAAGGLGLDQGLERSLELAGEALGLDGEVVDQAMGIDDIKIDASLLVGRIGGAVEQVG